MVDNARERLLRRVKRDVDIYRKAKAAGEKGDVAEVRSQVKRFKKKPSYPSGVVDQGKPVSPYDGTGPKYSILIDVPCWRTS